jgi:hypothetical protein
MEKKAMKRQNISMILLLILVLIGSLSCAGKYGIQFEIEDYEFGEVEEGTNVEIVYIFKNTGTIPLTIKDVKPGCGCTIASEWDRVVEPGKNGRIPVTFKSDGYPGDVIKTVDVITDIPDKPVVPLTLKGKVKNSFAEVSPRNIWLAEVSSATKELSGAFYIKNNSGIPFRIKEVIVPDIKTKHTLTELDKGMYFKFDFIVYPPFKGQGTVKKSFILKTDNEKQSEIELPFNYIVP